MENERQRQTYYSALIIRAKSLSSRVKKVEILKTQLDSLNILGPYIQFLD
jgi:hypothetical protein